MSHSRQPIASLAEKLLQQKESLLELMPEFKPIFKALADNNPAEFTKLGGIYQRQKKRHFTVVDLCSSDGKEKIGITEQIILFSLYKRVINRKMVINPQQKKEAIKLLADIGQYSFEWLAFQARTLLKIIRTNNATGDESDKALAGLNAINCNLVRFYWGAGHIKAALNHSELLSILALNNQDNRMGDRIEASQSIALEHTLCAKGLLNDDYSQAIFEMVAADKKIRNLFSKNPNLNQIPDDNAEALTWLANQFKSKLTEKKVDTSRAENSASFKVTQMQNVLNTTKQSLFHRATETTPSITPPATNSSPSNTK